MEKGMPIGGDKAPRCRVLFGAAVLLTALLATHAQAQREEHKLTLRAIMQELGAEHLRLTSALLIDDLKSVEESAKIIQGHPLPTEIVAAIKRSSAEIFALSNASTSKATKLLPVSPIAQPRKTSQDQR
jgi:hypothetical protein